MREPRVSEKRRQETLWKYSNCVGIGCKFMAHARTSFLLTLQSFFLLWSSFVSPRVFAPCCHIVSLHKCCPDRRRRESCCCAAHCEVCFLSIIGRARARCARRPHSTTMGGGLCVWTWCQPYNEFHDVAPTGAAVLLNVRRRARGARAVECENRYLSYSTFAHVHETRAHT